MILEINNKTRDQILKGDLPTAFENAIMDSSAANSTMSMTLLTDVVKRKMAMSMVLDMMENKEFKLSL
jgi:hypothetical protein